MRTTRRSTLYAAAALAAAAALTLTACGSDAADDGAKPAVEISGGNSKPGVVLDTPKAKPDLVLTDTEGEEYDFVAETAGKPTLLFFGYTNCPDVCPTTMSDIAIAKQKLPRAEQEKLQVVMVSTDPERDTPRRMGTWLDAQDKDFVGLTGDFAAVKAAAKSVGVHLEAPEKEKDGSITVSHGAEVLAYSPKDDKAHVLYLAGVTAEQYAKDMPKLVRGENP
ncbi:SCO family protein [Streptomyces sp. WMMC500]|uniref:SCO family protein n=1 Tax=Streptomyces sp. WMMC500 TaxID=3015154 RepID=UPI00248A938F|nr:SCO family protein [Streptomyces sp. WMMC500]WBB58011.1 SCO family protein [Streptomyces sp. WMMC500]